VGLLKLASIFALSNCDILYLPRPADLLQNGSTLDGDGGLVDFFWSCLGD